MDFSQRGFRSGSDEPAPAAAGGSHSRTKKSKTEWMKIGTVTLLFSVAILILALTAFTVRGGSGKKESSYVDSSKYQAVFLNGGQVYFGKVGTLNDKYMSLSNIYYLRVNQQVQPKASSSSSSNNNVSLVKLGCELHGPQDQMVINRDQIVFWENLKADGQVAKAVAEYQKQNPQGQQCQTSTTNTNTNTNTGQ